METPKSQTQRETIYCLKEDQSEFLEELTIEKSDVPIPQVMGETGEVVKLIPQEQAQNHTVEQIIDVPIPRMMEEILEVETLKSQRLEEESTLLADNKLSSKLDGSCATQAPEWEELQRLRAEGLVAIRDVNKLPNGSDSFELFEETLPSPSVMQVQSDGRGVVRRARALARKSSRSPGMALISMGIDRTQDEDTSLATDIKSHANAIADPTEQLTGTGERLTSVSAALHRSIQSTRQQHNNYHSKQAMQRREGKEEKGQEERERGRKGEGERGQAGRKEEEEKEAVGERSKQIEKDVMDWTVVRRNKGSDPDGGESDRRQSRRRDAADPERRGRVCDAARKSTEEKRKAEELRNY